MKNFFETLGFVVFSVVTAVGGFIVYCVLTDKLDLIEEMKERCGFHSCGCGGDCDCNHEFYEYDDLEEYFDEEDDEFEEDDFED